MEASKIQDYAIIGDSRSAALVSRAGSIDWLCWPRFESPSLFAALLDPAAGGCFRVDVEGLVRRTRRYVEDTNVLVTELETPDGRVCLTDFMPVYSETEKETRLVPEHEILRIVDCLQGEAAVDVRFEPRPDYARKEPHLSDGGRLGARLRDGARLYTLRSDAPLVLTEHAAVTSHFRLSAGERRVLSLTYDERVPAVLPPLGDYVDEALAAATSFWRTWASRCSYEGSYRAEVVRSLLTLKLLAYAPSGAIVAAPTTSLPERMGGELNWDYRYCWVRDASLTVSELLALGYEDEASAYVAWLLHCTRLTRPRLSVLYDVFGRLPKPEKLLTHLEGYERSRPVRIQNAAADQVQLDTYGEVIDAVASLCRHGAELDRETRTMLVQFGRYVCEHWREPDHGIWEPREAPQHHTHSRVLCWTALDRLLELGRAGLLGAVPTARFERERALIRRDVEERSWNEALGTYTQDRGGNTLDASLLLLGWYGFVDPKSPRLRATFEKIRERLECAPSLLYRYEESRIAGEGAFGICSFWAADYLARGGGRLDEAVRWFETLLPYANDVGLFAEEIDPWSGEALGNMPQAFTHVGLISAALAIEERSHREEEVRT